jgi:hypothetical protein
MVLTEPASLRIEPPDTTPSNRVRPNTDVEAVLVWLRV